MDITNITVKRIEGQKVLKGVASVVFDDQLKVRDIKILEKEDKGLYILMPNKRISEDRYVGYAYPVTEAYRIKIQDAILDKYYETT